MTTLPGVISYPIPAYQNVPIEPQNYQPQRFVIEAITLGATTLVETSENHDYVVGQLVRLIIPASCGCIQLNGAQGYVVDIPSQIEVRLSINSSVNVNQFSSPATDTVQPQILAIGDINNGKVNANGRNSTGTFIPGSFINISP